MYSGMFTVVALGIAVAFIIFLTAKVKMNAFMVLILAAFGYGIMINMPLHTILKSVKDGFGNTLGYIGIVIIAGTIMGTIMEKTGAAFATTNFLLKLVGKKFPQLALSLSGYFTSIAVFCDSGFVILSSINKALAKRSKLSITVTSVCLGTGLFASHCLIPPATGPIAAAEIIGVKDLGKLMVLGGIVAFFAMGSGFLWATFFAKKIYVEPELEESYDDLMAKFGKLPNTALAFAPILVPIILILSRSLTNPGLGLVSKTPTASVAKFVEIVNFVGDPVVALVIGAFVSLFLVSKENLGVAVNEWFSEGIKRAALIVAITGAGGAFGQVLKASPMGGFLGETLGQYSLGIFLPFIISAALKSSQGSSTVALMTAASIMAPLMPQLGLDPALTVCAIGAGAMTFSHANDSYFWVVTQFSNMKTATSYKVFSTATLIEGSVSIIVIFIISLFL